jgi:carbon storage regulator CsrA
MLVLSRKTGERIHIGENITIEIRRVAGNRVTLALEAPRDVRILRGELNQAAREFRDPADFQNPPTSESARGFQVTGFQATSEFVSSTENDAQSGPEPYAVIHRRLHVLPQISPAPPLPQPAAS